MPMNRLGLGLGLQRGGGASASPAIAPENTVPPAISGNAYVGSTLTATTGTWLNGVDTFAYQWKADGANVGSNQNTYVPVSGDVGKVITVEVTATNAGGSTPASSAATSAVIAVPVNTVAPAITGNALVGSTLTCSTGTWSGGGSQTYTYQWKSAGSNVGSNQNTYVPVTGDVGNTITCTVTASNAAGSGTPAESAATAAVEAAGAVRTYRGTNTVGNIGSGDHVWAAAPIGAATATRLVIAIVRGRRSSTTPRTITQVLFNGVAGTLHDQTSANDGVGASVCIGIASKIIDSGETVQITADYSSGLSQSAIDVYTLDGYNSATPTDISKAGGNDPSTSDLDVAAGGCVIAGFGGVGGTIGDMTLTGVTEENDQSVLNGTDGSNMRTACGSASGLGAQTGRTIAVSSGAGAEAFVAASWA
ncbi:MAG: hypothetical protein E5Y15_21180 [Mesorhizobium sp.]|nr:MAG: hypothetical protein E5Y15_21180 [Mesorhizobium sp.]